MFPGKEECSRGNEIGIPLIPQEHSQGMKFGNIPRNSSSGRKRETFESTNVPPFIHFASTGLTAFLVLHSLSKRMNEKQQRKRGAGGRLLCIKGI